MEGIGYFIGSHTRFLSAALDEDTIVGNCLMFLTEGTETSAITLTYAFYELAKNPEVQQKLFEEVSSCGELTSESLSNMRYLEQVIYGEFPQGREEEPGDCWVKLSFDELLIASLFSFLLL